MKNYLLILASLSLFSCVKIEADVMGETKPVSHDRFTSILKKHVSSGRFNYSALQQDSTELNAYLKLLETNPPNTKHWSEHERLAYWINAYNAFTLRLVIRNYPLKSIRDIAGSIPFVNSVWDIAFIKIGDKTYGLNDIEHGILRYQFKEPRIHFAINCASVSCPNLRPEAYTAKDLEKQLQEQAIEFLSDTSKNKISANEVQLSKIFRWFGGDFETENNDKMAYIEGLIGMKFSSEVSVDYMDYDWSLNE